MFQHITSWKPLVEEGLYEGGFTTEWRNGRSMFGGIVAAGIVRCLNHLVGDPDRILRTITIHFCDILAPGRALVKAQVERKSGHVTQSSARLIQNGHTIVTALSTFASYRNSTPDMWQQKPPDVPSPESIEPFPYIEGLMPVF